MKKGRIKVLYLLLTLGIIFQGCEYEKEEGVFIDETLNEVAEGVDVSLLSNNIIFEWNEKLLEVERYAQGRPNGSARALAYVYLATYETVVPAMPNYKSVESHLDGFRIRDSERAEEISWEMALSACFAKVLDHFMINLPANLAEEIALLETQFEEGLSLVYNAEIITNSILWGEYVANQVIEYSLTDFEAEAQIRDPQPSTYEPPVGDGFWTYSAEPERALYPYWESARTFVISPRKTGAVEPIPYSEEESSEYFAQMMDIYTRSNEAKAGVNNELWVAEFWSDDVEGLMFSPPARQVSIANQLMLQYELNMEESLALFLKLGFALNDAAVSAWKYKYDFMVMRPNVYIHEFIDPDFQTNLFRLIDWPNPSFPGYPSGHSTFASAAAGLFIETFGNETNFTDRSHEGRTEFLSDPRTFTSFEEMARENAFARVPLGVHMDMDCAEGLRLGYEISDAINRWDIASRVQ